jgi:electron transfer flavoprotein-quinone oxidoreductase
MTKCFDVIVVGAGPAGAAAAKTLAEGGAKVALLERGIEPGCKNVSGAALYDTAFLEKLYPGFHCQAPTERYITRKNLCFITENGMTSLVYHNDSNSAPPYKGYTVCRGKLDKWLAEKAVQAGANLFNQTVVRDVIKRKNAVTGVIVDGGERLTAPIIIGADGANSFVARAAGLRRAPALAETSLGVKEIISLPEHVIEERFQLKGREGATYEFVGSVSGGACGGGFLYTNKNSVSLGVVAQLSTLKECGLRPYELLNAFKKHPAIAPLIKDGQPMEYGAHLIPEGGFKALSKLCAPGILITGDAAGFVVVSGYLLLGINYALESGALAAKAALMALEDQRFGYNEMQRYLQLLFRSGMLSSFFRMRNAPHSLANNKNIANSYPKLICSIMNSLYDTERKPLSKILPMLWRDVRKSDLSLFTMLKDLIKMGWAIGI